MYFIGIKNIEELLKFAATPKIFVDLDGVLADFDKGFKDFAKMSPLDYQEKYGKPAFWKLLSRKEHFYRDLDWMPDGQELWNYIKQYNPTVLTAPAEESTMPYCKKDKKYWVKKHLGPNVKIIIDSNKENYADEDYILIDDREKNINQWTAAGGVGIKHTSATDTVKKLQRFL